MLFHSKFCNFQTVAQFTSEALFRERLHNRLNRVLTFSFANVIGKAQQKEKDRQSQPRQENQPGQETEKEYHGRPPTEIFGVLPGTWMEEIRGGQTVNGKRVNVAFAKSDGIIETMEGKRVRKRILVLGKLEVSYFTFTRSGGTVFYFLKNLRSYFTSLSDWCEPPPHRRSQWILSSRLLRLQPRSRRGPCHPHPPPLQQAHGLPWSGDASVR